jgi:hypothetical protein
MSIQKTYSKQPADVLDYDFDYSLWLSANDEIVSATIVSELISATTPITPLTIVSQIYAPTFAKVWLSAGVAGDVYKITCTITTASGRVKQDEIKLKIREY